MPIPVTGHRRVHREANTTCPVGEATLAPGGTMSVPAGLDHTAWPSMTGEAALYHVVAGDPAGLTRTG